MDVAAAMQHVENLTGLGERAEKRIVASRSLLLVEARSRPLGPSSGRDHAAVEVEREGSESFSGDTLEDDVPVLRLKFGYGLRVAVLEHAADGRNARQPLDAQTSQDDGILAVVVDVAQVSHAQQGVDHQ